MRAVIQRCLTARVEVDGNVVGTIEQGYLVLLGFAPDDGPMDWEWLARKVIGLRLFADKAGQMNRSLEEVGGKLLLVSQFTLLADYKKGNRPSWMRAAPPEIAEGLYEQTVAHFESLLPGRIARGRFGADMQVHLQNDGPVTLVIDTKTKQ